ncbi:MAG: HAD-IA family hydrolase [Puniceicoccales bacterium]|nr:HAD-IA family hydrolase [Puniceicoccales bacterium]
MNFKTVDTLIFDLGNVLFDWNPKKILSRVKKEFPDVPRSLLDITESPVWRLWDEGFLKRSDVVNFLGDSLDRRWVEKFVSVAQELFVPISERKTWLHLFKTLGCRLYFLSNLSEDMHVPIKSDPIFKYFDGGLFSYEEHLSKPDLRFYVQFLKKYPTVVSEQSLFIDDRPENIRAAQYLGWNGIVCSSFAGTNEILGKNFCFVSRD